MKAIELKSKPAEEVEQVVLFTLDGKDYTVAKKQRMNIGLKYMRAVTKVGPEQAAAELLESLIGEENFEVLCNFEDLTTEDFASILEAAQTLVMGGLEKVGKD